MSVVPFPCSDLQMNQNAYKALLSRSVPNQSGRSLRWRSLTSSQLQKFYFCYKDFFTIECEWLDRLSCFSGVTKLKNQDNSPVTSNGEPTGVPCLAASVPAWFAALWASSGEDKTSMTEGSLPTCVGVCLFPWRRRSVLCVRLGVTKDGILVGVATGGRDGKELLELFRGPTEAEVCSEVLTDVLAFGPSDAESPCVCCEALPDVLAFGVFETPVTLVVSSFCTPSSLSKYDLSTRVKG